MPFSPDTKIKALVDCGRCCCICHKFCGIKIECHHIIQEADSGQNTLENCIPLCFDCHADMLSYDDKHPKGTKYRPEELRQHRDRWYAKINTSQPTDYSDQHRRVDQNLFRRLLKVLPWSGSISFLSQNNFAGFSFDGAALNDLDNFYHLSKNPEWEFIDPTLEVMRATLVQHVGHLNHLLATNIFPAHRANYFTVPPEWEIDQPEHFTKVVNEIHHAAQQCVDGYRTLVREGRHRLAVEVTEEG